MPDVSARVWTVRPSADGKRWSAWPAGDKTNLAGLNFPSNNVAGSDVRLVWSGANMLPRNVHTAIWSVRHVHHTGYYATAWHTSNDGTWHASRFEFGTHPYPNDGVVHFTGQALNVGQVNSPTHYYEIAGLGAFDYIASPGPGQTTLVVKDVWKKQARQAAVVGDNVVHRFWPDLENASVFIEHAKPLSEVDSAAALAVSPVFQFGASPWTVSGSANAECLSGVLRNVSLYSAALSLADIQAEAANATDTPVTSAGQAGIWYSNKNPTPTDVGDKSGAGHTPVWANANRPTLWEG